MSIEFVRKALDRSFVMGQNYWADAESESRAANRRSDVTRQKFNTMRDEICEATATMLAEKDALLRQALEVLENLQSKTHDGMNGEFRICCATRPDEFHEHCETTDTIEAIRQNLGVKND